MPRVFKNYEISGTIYSKSEISEQFLKQNAILTCSWTITYISKCKKNIGIQKPTGKVRKTQFSTLEWELFSNLHWSYKRDFCEVEFLTT